MAVPLAALARKTYREAYAPDMDSAAMDQHLRRHLSDDAVRRWFTASTVWVALSDSAPIGFVQLGLVEPAYANSIDTCTVRPTDAQVHRLYVDAAQQNQGLGTRLLQTAVTSFLEQSGAARRSLFIDVWETNHAAQRLYARHGFQPVGRHPSIGIDGEIDGYDLVLRLRRG